MKDLIKKYENLAINRSAIIILLSAPVPAAMIKLQGSLLDEVLIGLVLMSASLLGSISYWVNKYGSWKSVMGAAQIFFIGSVLGLLFGYLNGVSEEKLIFSFTIFINMAYFLNGIYSSKIKNLIKDKIKEDFDLARFDAKKNSVMSTAGLLGQGLSLSFYSVYSPEPIMVLLVAEIAKMVSFTLLEYKHYLIVKGIESK